MEKKSFYRRMKMSVGELEEYYHGRRADAYEKNELIRGVPWRKSLPSLFKLGLHISRMITGEKRCVIKDKQVNTGKPLIYTCTHIGNHDMEMAFAAIKSHAYAFWGDPKVMYRRIEGVLLNLNGAICVDSDHKQDRYIGKETSIRLLQRGGSLLIFPEGAWNIIENQVVMLLFSGTAEMAIRAGVEIVPIAMEQYDKKYYVNIGPNIDFGKYDVSHKKEASDRLRDILCTLKWEIWERYGAASRKDPAEGYDEIFL